jgi:hypothetical protein
LTKGHIVRLIFWKPSYRVSKALSEKPVPTLPAKKESFRPVVTDKQSAKVCAAAFWWGVTADDEFLLQGKLDFDRTAGQPRVQIGKEAIDLDLHV